MENSVTIYSRVSQNPHNFLSPKKTEKILGRGMPLVLTYHTKTFQMTPSWTQQLWCGFGFPRERKYIHVWNDMSISKQQNFHYRLIQTHNHFNSRLVFCKSLSICGSPKQVHYQNGFLAFKSLESLSCAFCCMHGSLSPC